jgi:hypothetical protein
MSRITKEQAAIIGCFTGTAMGPFSDVHKKAEELFGRPIFTHEFGQPDIWGELKEKVRPEFLAICYEEDEE